MNTTSKTRTSILIALVCAACAIAGRAAEQTDAKPAATATQVPMTAEILFCERNPGRDYAGHYYANFGYDCGNVNYWLHGADGGRLAIYSPGTGSVRTLLEDAAGAVRDPQIHYDGKRVLFSYRKGGTHHYNLYEMNLDGSGLRQITRGDWDDIEPTYLPDGGIAFCSTRCKRYVPCWLAPVAVLFRCDADGGSLRQLSSGNAPENTPAVLPDGRILYTRWEYVNRDAVSFHHLWTMNPDGTGVMVYYGNMHPGGVFIDAQPIGGTGNVIFVNSGGHGALEHAGRLTLLSLRNGPDDRSQAKPITGDGFRDPYPLTGHEFLAARGNEIVSVTDDGGVRALWKSERMVHEPRLIAPRPRQTVIPSRADLSQSTGTLVLTNVYEGRNMDGVKHVILFKNEGGKAGASIAHTHSQIMALPILPPKVAAEAAAYNCYRLDKASCPYCDIIKEESNKSRIIWEDEYLFVLAPYASDSPYGAWFLPKRHIKQISDLTHKEKESFAGALKVVLGTLDEIGISYNYFIENAVNSEDYHMHIKLSPRPNVWAGLELGTGVIINPIPPEYAAKLYRGDVKIVDDPEKPGHIKINL